MHAMPTRQTGTRKDAIAKVRSELATKNATKIPAPLATLTRRIEPLSAAGIAAPRSRRMNGSSPENAHASAIQNGMAAGQINGSGYNRYSSSGSATATAPLREGGPFRTDAGLCANG